MKRSVQVLLSLAMLNVFLPQAHAAQSSLDIANEDIGSILNSVWVPYNIGAYLQKKRNLSRMI